MLGALLALALRPRRAARAEVGTPWSDIREGWRYARGRPDLLGSYLVDVNAMVFGGITRVSGRHGVGLLWAATAWGVAIAVFGMVHNVVLALVLLAIAGGADMVSGLYRMAIWNQTIPNDLRGRLGGIEMLSYSLGPTLGNVEAGMVAAATSVRTSVVTGGIACVVVGGGLAVALPALRRYRAPASELSHATSA